MSGGDGPAVTRLASDLAAANVRLHLLASSVLGEAGGDAPDFDAAVAEAGRLRAENAILTAGPGGQPRESATARRLQVEDGSVVSVDVPEPGVDSLEWRCRYSVPTRSELLAIASVLGSWRYIVAGAPTMAIALDKVRQVRRALTTRSAVRARADWMTAEGGEGER